jgi:hypothetical protein
MLRLSWCCCGLSEWSGGLEVGNCQVRGELQVKGYQEFCATVLLICRRWQISSFCHFSFFDVPSYSMTSDSLIVEFAPSEVFTEPNIPNAILENSAISCFTWLLRETRSLRTPYSTPEVPDFLASKILLPRRPFVLRASGITPSGFAKVPQLAFNRILDCEARQH